MTEKIIDADKLVRVYIKMRDAKAHMVAEHDAKVLELEEKMALVEHELLDICKTTGQDGGKTAGAPCSPTQHEDIPAREPRAAA